jgi:hypothetical protein
MLIGRALLYSLEDDDEVLELERTSRPKHILIVGDDGRVKKRLIVEMVDEKGNKLGKILEVLVCVKRNSRP